MSKGVLVDTNIFSYLLKRDTRALLYQKHLQNPPLYDCFATIAELYEWAIRRQWGQRRIDEIHQKLSPCVLLNFDDNLAWQWARIRAIPGRPIEPGDAWIAAAALRHGLPLVTHNRKHFEHIPGLIVISDAS